MTLPDPPDRDTSSPRTLGADSGGTSKPSVHLPPIFLDGEVIDGRFEVRGLLGQGGMGQVFAAFDRELQTEVAIKVVRPDKIDAQGLEQRFRREVEISRRVTHPNVCRVFDLFTVAPATGGWGEKPAPLLLLTMELVAGQTLAARLDQTGPVPLTEARPWIEQIAAALDAAHCAGVTHRDLKPSNIVLRPPHLGGEAVVTDFGLARSTGTSTVDGFEGTPGYAAPEVHDGAEGDVRSDVFSFGVIVHELLLGSRPGADDRRLATLPRRIRSVLRRCLDPHPSQRYESAGEAARALFADSGSSRRWWLVAGAAAVVVTGLVAIGYRASSRPAETDRWSQARQVYRVAPAELGSELDVASQKVLRLAESGATPEALAALQSLREGLDLTTVQRVGLELLEAEVAERSGQHQRLLAASNAALAAASEPDMALARARAGLYRAAALYHLGDGESAARAAADSLQLLHQLGDDWSRARATLRFDLEFLEEHQLIDRTEALEIFRGVGDLEGEARLLVRDARSRLHGHPQPRVLAAEAEQILLLAREASSFRAEAEALNLRALVRWALGDEAGSIEGFRQALRAADASGDQIRSAGYSMNLALQLQHYGDSPEIRERLEGAVATYRRLGSQGDLARGLANLARYHRNHDNYDEAERLAREALATAEGFGNSWLIYNSWELLTTVFVEAKRFGDARAAGEQALALARTDEQRDWNRLRLARIDRRAGDPARARPAVLEIVQRHGLDLADASLAVASRLEYTSVLENLGDFAAAAISLEEVLPVLLDSGSKMGRHRRARQAARLHLALQGESGLPDAFAEAVAAAEDESRFDDLALAALEREEFLSRIGQPQQGCGTLRAANETTHGRIAEQLEQRLLQRLEACPPTTTTLAVVR